jgi:peptidoglycan-N-acetylmuramic acid deacetylase
MKRKGLILAMTLLLISPIFLIGSKDVEANGYSNKPIHWGFKKSSNHNPPSAGTEYEELLAKYGSFYLADTEKKEIYLTFDNGYENGFTAPILDVLKDKKVPATFFVTGHYLKDQADLVKRMVKEGHIVGNHSWHHPDMTTLSEKKMEEELKKVNEEFKRLTGSTDMMYLRAPRGIFSERTLAITKKLGYTNVFWSLAFLDWKINEQKGWEYAYENIMKQIHPGAIILLHTVSKDNAEALGKAIDDLHKEGYTFRSLDDLMLARELPEPLKFMMQN